MLGTEKQDRKDTWPVELSAWCEREAKSIILPSKWTFLHIHYSVFTILLPCNTVIAKDQTSGFPGSAPVYPCCPHIIIINDPFHTQKCLSFCKKLYDCLTINHSLYTTSITLLIFLVRFLTIASSQQRHHHSAGIDYNLSTPWARARKWITSTSLLYKPVFPGDG